MKGPEIRGLGFASVPGRIQNSWPSPRGRDRSLHLHAQYGRDYFLCNLNNSLASKVKSSKTSSAGPSKLYGVDERVDTTPTNVQYKLCLESTTWRRIHFSRP
ncbi:hypothetical protein M758_8G120400 [Ceratodon purpureus]|nr:hypothetical protein M758_9G028800 [Ceratodon purpureus]KAG0608625.1 hypothetical protein M758_8G120400 [Ceratodon purpureus]